MTSFNEGGYDDNDHDDCSGDNNEGHVSIVTRRHIPLLSLPVAYLSREALQIFERRLVAQFLRRVAAR